MSLSLSLSLFPSLCLCLCHATVCHCLCLCHVAITGPHGPGLRKGVYAPTCTKDDAASRYRAASGMRRHGTAVLGMPCRAVYIMPVPYGTASRKGGNSLGGSAPLNNKQANRIEASRRIESNRSEQANRIDASRRIESKRAGEQASRRAWLVRPDPRAQPVCHRRAPCAGQPRLKGPPAPAALPPL